MLDTANSLMDVLIGTRPLPAKMSF